MIRQREKQNNQTTTSGKRKVATRSLRVMKMFVRINAVKAWRETRSFRFYYYVYQASKVLSVHV